MHTFLFIVACAAFLCFIIGGVAAWAEDDKARRKGSLITSVSGLLVFLLFFMFAGLRSVPVHSEGVKTAGGRIEGTLAPGWHWFNAPWANVNILDETVQTQQWRASSWNPSDANPACMTVRIGGQQLACVNITIKWQLEDRAAPTLFNDYDNAGAGGVMNSITNNLVTVDLNSVANQVFGDYNPILDAKNLASSGASSSQFSKFGPQILRDMQNDLHGKIAVLSINLGNAFYATATEARLAGIANQVADTAVAQEELLTNQALAKANAASQSGLTPLVAYNNCVQGTINGVKQGETFPTGWTCGTPTSIAALAAGK